ncbi:hypothetical protein BKA61DRAFT_650523 [Leptodontidium sp. MPI-SDFR-AT-0119]|nr:hypothetical protein BKA61DRAFT_650523 [Leptodontidium sp. MPI-SDFR-AT-0119]
MLYFSTPLLEPAISMDSMFFYNRSGTTVTGSIPAPPGVVPNLEHPQDVLKTTNLVVEILCLLLATPCVLLRLYIKARIIRMVGIEDWCCLIAGVLATAFFISGIMMGIFGGGYHDWEVRKDLFIKFKQETYFDIILNSPTLFFTKSTILLVFVRVFAPMEKAVKGIYAFIIVMGLYYAASTISKIWICTPIGAFWNPSIRVSCINTVLLFRIDNYVSVITDALICILPVPLMWSIQMTTKKKIGIGLLLGAGGLATACSGTRLIYTSIVDKPDATLGAMVFKMLASSEIAIALACACIPSFNALFSRMSAKSKAKHSNYTSSVKLSKLSNLGKGSRGIKSNPMINCTEDGFRRHTSLERILNNPSNTDEDFGYRVKVFADSGPDSSFPGASPPPEDGMRVSHDHRTTRSPRYKDMV